MQLTAETTAAVSTDRQTKKPHDMWLMLILSIPLFFDSADIHTFASAAPALIHTWGITIQQIALVTSMTFVGMFFGSMLGGALSDRIGRKLSLAIFVLISSTSSLATGLVPNLGYLLAFRVTTGFGLSASIVTVMTYISELYPPGTRGTWQSWAMVFNLSAIPITNLVARLVVPMGNNGWRWVFVWGALGFLFLPVVPLLPESPVWLQSRGRKSSGTGLRWSAGSKSQDSLQPEATFKPQKVSRRQSWGVMFSGPYLRRTLALSSIWGLQVLGFYGFQSWVPTLLVKHGLTITRSLTYFTLMNIGMPLGALLAVYLADRFERKYMISALSALIAVCGLLYGLSFMPPMIIGFGFLVGMLSQTMITLLYAYTPEQFPTNVRNTATGLTYSVGRITTVANAFIIAAIYTHFNYVAVFVYIAGVWVAVSLVTILFGAKTTGRSLEELNPSLPSETRA